jgi:hypothetical protein
MKTVLVYTFNAGQKIAKTSCGLARFTANVDDTWIEARRALRKTYRAGQDFVDEVTFAIKRKPLESMGAALGIGIGVGAVVGWLGTKRR